MPDWLTCDELLEGQMPPPRNHAVVNRDVLMEVISSLKVGKKQLQQWLYFVQFVISRLSSRNDGSHQTHANSAKFGRSDSWTSLNQTKARWSDTSAASTLPPQVI